MSVLRIRTPPPDSPSQWAWALIDTGSEPLTGEGPLSQLPPQLLRHAERFQLLLPASQVMITRVRLPAAVKRRSGSLLAYAVEDSTASEPDANEVSWLGSVDGADVLAVIDRKQLGEWRESLGTAGIHNYSVCCDSLLLPLPAQRWSCAWEGSEGIVRTGAFEGAATDIGDRHSPPLSLGLLLECAKARGETPTAIDLHVAGPDALPDIEAWQRTLGIAIHPAPRWDWRRAREQAGVNLLQERRGWRLPAGTLARLRPAAWIVGIALSIHAVALVVDWARLAGEQRSLRAQMEARFRSVFPETVAVADPALQMRRKLAEVRRAANKPDDGDFAVMIVKVAGALKALPAGVMRAISYESGRMTLEFAADDLALPGRISAQLVQSGLAVSTVPAAAAGRRTITMTVRAL